MKLFKISQTQHDGYDTFDSAIVCAVDENAAQQIHPQSSWDNRDDPWKEDHYFTWASTPDQVTVEYIGEAKEGMEAGVVLASFNAG